MVGPKIHDERQYTKEKIIYIVKRKYEKIVVRFSDGNMLLSNTCLYKSVKYSSTTVRDNIWKQQLYIIRLELTIFRKSCIQRKKL